MIALFLPGNIPIYVFSLLLALGAFLGMLWVVLQSPDKQKLRNMEAGIWTLLGALVGGRAVFVAVHWAYFHDHPWEILQVYLGGLSWPGALAGGMLALAFFILIMRQSLVDAADALIPLLVCLSVSALLGCWFDGCGYGATTSYWWGVPSPDEWGVVTRRSPVQLLGAIFAVGLFWSSDHAVRRGSFKPGTLACLGLLNLSLITFGLSFLRVDPVLSWRGMNLDAWAALFFAGLGLFAFLVIYGRKKRET